MDMLLEPRRRRRGLYTLLSGTNAGVSPIFAGRIFPPLVLTRAQVAGVQSSAADALGGLAFFNADVPRFAGSVRRLLVEGQRTNLLTGMAAPSTQNVAVTAVAHTLSFFGTGSVTLSGAATGTLAGTGANDRVSLTFTPAAGTLTLTVSGLVTRAQLEVGAFASSYVEAASGQATRGADLLTAPLSSLGIGANGACTVLLSAVVSNLPINQWLVQIDAGNNTDRYALAVLSSQTQLRLGVGAFGNTTANAIGGGLSRMGLTIDGAGTARAVLDNGAVISLGGGATSGLSVLRIGNAFGSNAPLFGEIGTLRVVPYPLSDADLQAAVAGLPA